MTQSKDPVEDRLLNLGVLHPVEFDFVYGPIEHALKHFKALCADLEPVAPNGQPFPSGPESRYDRSQQDIILDLVIMQSLIWNISPWHRREMQQILEI